MVSNTKQTERRRRAKKATDGRAQKRARTKLVRQIRDDIAGWRFGAQRTPSRVTLPLVFERGE